MKVIRIGFRLMGLYVKQKPINCLKFIHRERSGVAKCKLKKSDMVKWIDTSRLVLMGLENVSKRNFFNILCVKESSRFIILK